MRAGWIESVLWPDGVTRCQPCAQYLSVCHWDIPLATVLVLISSQKMTLFNTHWHPTGSSTLNTATLKVKIWSLKNLFLICLLILSLGRLALPLNTQLLSTSTADGNSGRAAKYNALKHNVFFNLKPEKTLNYGAPALRMGIRVRPLDTKYHALKNIQCTAISIVHYMTSFIVLGQIDKSCTVFPIAYFTKQCWPWELGLAGHSAIKLCTSHNINALRITAHALHILSS